ATAPDFSAFQRFELPPEIVGLTVDNVGKTACTPSGLRLSEG
ncbi:MAG: hypothetical protein K0R45_3379, partial [Pseudomonas sp.]|nr:hypothetical protein [Pseudomonas sp.]